MMQRRSLAAVFLFVATLLVLFPAASHAYTVRTSHPRLLLTPELLPVLRQRCQTTHRAMFMKLRDLVDRRMDEGRKDARYVDDFAFVWLMTQDTRYRDYAIQATIWNAQNGNETDWELSL
ncbi:MAG: hypothetical protein QUU85_09685, partial [Candidatus Eisenbacteria bacterium]|nr:hypothetical protein [Candidatus Eisenbacteria bacterium]